MNKHNTEAFARQVRWNKLKEMLKTFAFAFFVAALVMGVVFYSTKSFGQSKTFPIGKKIHTQALFCLDKDAAQLIAKLQGQRHPLVEHVVREGRCVIINGFAVYVRRVETEGDWAVWEVHFGETKVWEATDWKAPES